MNILGILIIYDPNRAIPAIECFRTFIDACSSTQTTVIVNNNSNLDIGLKGRIIEGSNISAEFSGWDEALDNCDFMDFDIVIYANDTFYTRDRFDDCMSNALKSMLLKKRAKNYIIGEVCWSINYSNLKKGKKFLLRWVRTSIFAISKDAMAKIGRVGIDWDDTGYRLTFDTDKKFSYGQRIPDLISKRIDNWLFPAKGSSGWHSADKVNDDILKLKAQSVLQELILTRNCEIRKIKVVDYRSPFSLKTLIFRILYVIQKILPE